MGWFRREKPAPVDLPTTGHDGDDQVLAQLAGMGTELTAPRLWEHFLYCDDADGATSLSTQARAEGWTVTQVEPPSHGIVASRSDRPVTPDTVRAARAYFASLATSVSGGEYDGWGAAGD